MKLSLPYADRAEAGRALAAELTRYKGKPDVRILGLARGGLPVAAEVASELHAPLEAFLVRKLSLPSEPEFAFGAVTVDGTRVLDEDVVRRLGIPANVLDAITKRVQTELKRRERLYRSDRPPLDLTNQTVILVDDGLATGATMQAAVRFVRQQSPKQIIVAVPVASAQAIAKLRPHVDQCVCPAIPEFFYAVGEWYEVVSRLIPKGS